MTTLATRISSTYQRSSSLLDYLQPVLLLGARFYIAWVFFASGLTKLRDWESTLLLFEYEYSVPFLNFELAAYLATFGEIVLPILLILGLLTRFSAMGITIINIIAVISLEEIAPAAYILHILWGILLAQLIVFGGGYLSIDKYIKHKSRKSQNAAM